MIRADNSSETASKSIEDPQRFPPFSKKKATRSRAGGFEKPVKTN